MPELPEVESVRLGVHEWTAGTTITGAEVIDPRILGTTSQRRINASAVDEFVAAVSGRRIIGAERRGKFMWLTLGEDLGAGPAAEPAAPELSLLVHLGMSGQLRVHNGVDEIHKHTRAILRLERGSESLQLRFVDQRIFGHLGVQPLVHAYGRLVPASANHIAADPLEPAFEPGLALEQLSRKRTVVKSALLDQSLVSGIGNIYADEALFRAGIHPLAIPARTRKSRLATVLDSASRVMGDALAVGGTSFDALYVNVNGESGYFDRALLVYGRGGQECVRCGTEIEKMTIGGRGSHFCPNCQRPPRYR
ncbi:bifunctional DNA-formamidopyrimidine glycosylase/DNA-(apurinic or apyrimidinic site) lyase [Brevibacterium sp. UCMA 11754]|uniref:bifunctional DNA-formamidopyrimidine glycosylase/DNA-(apurinic or apyrimidinic site) lyase n=1 Tax=Brevibacterium sp. UCMA 11754 TaxID=2749198 RepID=UPI001F2F30EE|nr:bifunctional DNA-formamidopyrimidine glycosylase/DNA-(apurinic or apyrimidinic site) lyase [Brevibacterium sp. UCMA 11754]MCF2573017.1 bifunctional DNA-formamidopyrimidine glycosylase/DNA-(apurinic or apyrimidinic site) lyase [Brevibacterium sp. UCMA 11754]